MHRLFNREQSAFDIYPFRSRFRLTWPFADETMFARDEIMKTILSGLTALLACVTGAFLSSSTARADTFTAGEFLSYSQDDWTFDAPASTLLGNNFDSVYASNGFSLDVGIGFSISFTSAAAVQAYIPTPGLPGTLTLDQGNPTTTASGEFGGDVTALALDVNFSDFGVLHGTSTTPFGNLLITGFNPNSALFGLDGMSVRTFLVLVETALGGGSTDGYTLDDLDSIAAQIGGGFEDGNVSDFANEYLECPGTCTAATPLPGALPLFAGGLGVVALLARRRKSKVATV